MCAVLDITADAVGTLYTIAGVLATALVASTSAAVAVASSLPDPMIITAGTIDLSMSASNTGATKWDLYYIPLDSTSTVVSA